MRVSPAMADESKVRWAPQLQARGGRGMPGPVPRRFGMPRQAKPRLTLPRLPRLVVALGQVFVFAVVVDALLARWFVRSTGIASTSRASAYETFALPGEKATASREHSDALDESDPRDVPSDKSEATDSRDSEDTNSETDVNKSQDAPAVDSARPPAIDSADSDSGKETVVESDSKQKPWEVLPRRSDWEESAPPGWCAQLAKEPRPWTATPDAYVYLKHFKNLRRRGSYLDIAANEPIDISNTFYMDRCLGWKGVCVEANPKYFDKLSKLRSCNLVKTCISDSNAEVTFRLSGAVGGLETTVKTAKKASDKTIRLRCKTLKQLADEYKLTMVDYLSLDVEGNEAHVLKGWDPKKLVIKVINVESNNKEVDVLLQNAGYRRHVTQPVEEGGKPGAEYDLRYHMDKLYLHESVTWGRPE